MSVFRPLDTLYQDRSDLTRQLEEVNKSILSEESKHHSHIWEMQVDTAQKTISGKCRCGTQMELVDFLKVNKSFNLEGENWTFLPF